jgi:CBS domain-containing protein
MQAKELMTHPVECISPDMRLQDAARVMKTLDVGFLPVCENDRLIGTITDRDMVLRVIAEGRVKEDLKARDIMSPAAFWCYEDQTASEVGDYMSKKEIRRVLILDRNKRLAGVVSIGDLAKGGEQDKAGEAIGIIAEAPPAQAA